MPNWTGLSKYLILFYSWLSSIYEPDIAEDSEESENDDDDDDDDDEDEV